MFLVINIKLEYPLPSLCSATQRLGSTELLPDGPHLAFEHSIEFDVYLLPLLSHPLSWIYFFQLFSTLLSSDVGSVEGLAYHRGWDMLYWTSYTTSTITRHTVDQSRWGAVDWHTVVTMSGDDHPRAFVLDECQRLELIRLFIYNHFAT